ncbi:hypothetical protein GCM10011297_01970 [Bacterioplanes sanyensis]|uniref:hypothetical protein n=1 Tax=Bacterioplanes sanyensis TaxID=1249553 RepID=UPI0016718B52|nr:hypothetical protein [Bacterioplanes sanyensis]GGY32654.1 hypothetical protein GCM10011297_01970 [Bacterioplanes sanyensis]
MLQQKQGESLPGELSTAVRLVTLLSLVPVEPHRINTVTLEQKLFELGYDVSARTIQRDMKKLHEAGIFGLACDTRTRPYRWFVCDQLVQHQRPRLSLVHNYEDARVG